MLFPIWSRLVRGQKALPQSPQSDVLQFPTGVNKLCVSHAIDSYFKRHILLGGGGGGGGGGGKANLLLANLNNINQCPRQQLGQLKQVPAMAGINIECLRHTQLD